MSTRTGGLMRQLALVAFVAVALLAAASRVAADEHLSGTITVRGDTTFTMTLENASPVIVMLQEATKIESPFKPADLIPGLRVKVAGTYDGENRFLARRITFNREEHEIAVSINAGLTPTNQRVTENTAAIQNNTATLHEHRNALDSHGRTLTTHQDTIDANDMKMVATTGAITNRINNIDEYEVVDKVVVYFKNGCADVTKSALTQLQDFAIKAKGINAYKVQVQGYASAVGPRALNETLSMQRAEAVTSILHQQGIAPANILVPAAMGISEQFAENATAQGQSENRRVIVTLLQSRGLIDR